MINETAVVTEWNNTFGVLSTILENYLYWMPFYFQALVIFAGFIFLAFVVMKVSQKVILKIAQRTKTNLDELVIERTNRPIAIFLVLLGLRLAIVPIKLIESAQIFSVRVIYSFMIIVSAYILIAIFDAVIDVSSKKWQNSRQLIKMFYRFSRVIIVLLFFAFVLDIWGVKVAPFLAGLGVAGIAIAFALQATLGNIFGGVALIMDNAYRVGDVIKLESGEMGIVHKVGLRSTKIRTWDNEILMVPNGKLADSRIQNLMQPDRKIRISVKFGVEYGSDIDKVKKAVLSVVNKLDILKDPEPQVLFLNMGDFALEFTTRFWVDDIMKKLMVMEQATCDIYKSLRKSGIVIAFPTSTVYLKKGKK